MSSLVLICIFHQPSRHLCQGSKAAHASPSLSFFIECISVVLALLGRPHVSVTIADQIPNASSCCHSSKCHSYSFDFLLHGVWRGRHISHSQTQPIAIHPATPTQWHISTAMHTSPAASSAPLPTHHPSLVRCVWMGRMSLCNDAKK